MTTAIDTYAREARRQYRVMARAFDIDSVLAETRNMPVSARVCRYWATRLRYLAATEGTAPPNDLGSL